MVESETFLCDPVTFTDKNGAVVRGARVYTCTECRKQRCQEPAYDLFDGVDSNGKQRDIGISDYPPPALSKLAQTQRLRLALIKMHDASFKGYSGQGYGFYKGGGQLTPQDYSGLMGLAVQASGELTPDNAAQLDEALQELRKTHPEVAKMLTVMERATDPHEGFSARSGGAAAMPTIPLDELDSDDNNDGAPLGVTRTLAPGGIVGVLVTVDTLDIAANTIQLHQTTVGNTVSRGPYPDVQECPYHATSKRSCAENLANTALYTHGEGGWYKHPNACPIDHHSRARFFGVNTYIAEAAELLLFRVQQKIKMLMNMNPLKFVSGKQVLKDVSKAMLRAFGENEQAAAENLHKVNPEALQHVVPNSSLFSGSMNCTVVGSKQYWAKAYMDLLAMLHERGLPKYFVTFTANEGGWTNMNAACGGRHHAEVPVNSTRHYFHRFDEFYAAYLKPGTQSPLGKIAHVWYRHEDQQRGSLHVHAAVWIDGEATHHAIVGYAPKAPTKPVVLDANATRQQRDAYAKALISYDARSAWRQFVIKVQNHDCRAKCFEQCPDGKKECRYLYPRTIRDDWGYNADTDRNEYPTFDAVDAKLSPYVAEWLLAWGAGMNIQYCTSSGFLSYIAKYITKPEPYGRCANTNELAMRNASPVDRFLNARMIGAPEIVAIALHLRMKSRGGSVLCTTKLPERRIRAIARNQTYADDDDLLKYYDGSPEKYANRPEGIQTALTGKTHDFEAMFYTDFHRLYTVATYARVSKHNKKTVPCLR